MEKEPYFSPEMATDVWSIHSIFFLPDVAAHPELLDEWPEEFVNAFLDVMVRQNMRRLEYVLGVHGARFTKGAQAYRFDSGDFTTEWFVPQDRTEYTKNSPDR